MRFRPITVLRSTSEARADSNGRPKGFPNLGPIKLADQLTAGAPVHARCHCARCCAFWRAPQLGLTPVARSRIAAGVGSQSPLPLGIGDAESLDGDLIADSSSAACTVPR